MIRGKVNKAKTFGNDNQGTIGDNNQIGPSAAKPSSTGAEPQPTRKHASPVGTTNETATATAVPHKPVSPQPALPPKSAHVHEGGVVPATSTSQSPPLLSIVPGKKFFMRNTSKKLLYAAIDLKHKKIPGVVSSSEAEQWIFAQAPNNQWTIQSSSSQEYMALDKNNHLQLLLSAPQAWDIRPLPDSNGFKVYAPHRNDLVLKVSGSNVKFEKVVVGRGDDIWEVEAVQG